ncbi:MAG: hypothetical protein WCL32_19255 [Planctomycetota bacterium]
MSQTSHDPESTSSFRFGLILFLVSLSMLSAQITVTRLLSYKLFFHFVFLMISLAQLGIAAAGAWIFAGGKDRLSPEFYRTSLYAMAVTLLAFLGFYVWLAPAPTLGLMKIDGLDALPYLGGLSLILVAYYFAAGCVLSGAFTQHKAVFNRLYAADLAGAAVGCVAALGLMAVFGPVRTFLASGLLAVAAAAIVSPGRASKRSLQDTAGMIVTAALLVAGWIATPNLERAATLGRDFDGSPLQGDLEYRWTHLARVDRIAPSFYVIDGDAGTRIDNPDWVSELEFLVSRPHPRVAIVGVGAGPQLKEALRHRPESVLGIDINATIVEWSRQQDRGANGDIYNLPEVKIVVDEGRHALRVNEGPFDVIDMHAIDTYTASSMGAYSLTENFLYTVEAFEEFYARLSDDGVMAIRRWLFYPPRENLRLFTTIFTALGEAGVAKPEDHLVVLAPHSKWRDPSLKVMGFLMFSKRPFTAERMQIIDQFVAKNGWDYVYGPGRKVDSEFTKFVDSTDRAKYYREYQYFVEPCRDANPFFFQFTPPLAFLWQKNTVAGIGIYNQSTTTLFVTLLALSVLCALLLGVPILRFQKRSGTARPSLAATVYFAALGLGFMAVELAGIQIMTLLLGHPTYALSVVLLGLLAFAGVGSLLARWVPRTAGPRVCLLLAGLALLAAVGLMPLVQRAMSLGLPARVALTLLVLCIIGVPIGMPMALGVREIGDANSLHVAWAWACNGAAGVVGTNICMILMIYFGIPAIFGIGAGCYLLAQFLLPRIAAREAAKD